VDGLVIGDHDGDRRIELAKAAQHPILSLFFVMALDAHGLK